MGAVMNESANRLGSLDSINDGNIDDSYGSDDESEYEAIIRKIVEIERKYYFEKRNVKTERQRKIRELVEQCVDLRGMRDDS